MVVAYRSAAPPPSDVAQLRARIRAGAVDVVTFTSPSTARNFVAALGEEGLMLPAVVIGPVTKEAAEGLGYRVVAQGEPHTTDGLIIALRGWATADHPTSEPRP